MKLTFTKTELNLIKYLCRLFHVQYVLIDGVKVGCPK